MADIVPTLFGFSPEMYQRQQQQRADEQAMAFARLSPIQKASFGVQQGAGRLAGAIGGMLGGQDPELQRITMRQQIAGQLNPNDPASIQQAIVALQQAGDTEGAMMLQGEFRKLQESNALVAQRTASARASDATATRERGPTGDVAKAMRAGEITRALQTPDLNPLERAGLEAELSVLSPAKETKEPTTPDIINAAAFAASKGKPGTPEYTAAFQSKHAELISKAPPAAPSVGADREAIAQAAPFNKPYAQLTPDEKAKVNQLADQKALDRAKATAPNFTMPGGETLGDVTKFRFDVQKTIRPQLDAVTAADNAITGIEDSMRTGNFISFNAARVQLAKSLGDNQLSRRDVEQAGGDPSILGGLADTASTLFTGTPTLDTQNKIKSTLLAIKKVSSDKANAEIASQRKIALRNKKYDPVAIDEALNFPEFRAAPAAAIYATNPTTKARIMSTDGGKTWTPVR